MWIKRIVIKNVGPFGPTPDRHIDIELQRGMIGVFGANGRGKSTLLNAMYAGLTNDFGRFPAIREKCVTDTAPEGAKAFVRLEVEHNGIHLDVTRGIQAVESVLIVDGDKKKALRKAGEIETALGVILGVDKHMLSRFVFKGQNDTSDFIANTDAVRKRAFQTLCRTEVCESIWDMLGEYLNNSAEARDEIVDNSDELTALLSQHELQVKELKDEAERLRGKLLDEAREKKYRRWVRNSERHTEILEEIRELTSRIDGLALSQTNAQENRDKRAKKHKAIGARVDALAEVASSAKSALNAWAAYEKNVTYQRKLRVEAKALDEEEKSKKKPKPPLIDDFTPAKFRKRLAVMQGHLESAKVALAKLDKDGVTECPTCGSPVASFESHLAELRNTVDTYPDKIESIEADLKAYDAYAAALETYERWKVGFAARRKSNDDCLARAQSSDAPKGTREELEESVTKYEDGKAELADSQEKLTEREKTLATAKARYEAAIVRHGELADRATKTEVSEENYRRAEKRLARHTTAREALASVNGRLQESNKQVESSREALRRLRVQLKRAKKLRSMLRIVERGRELFHRDNLPNRVAQINLSRMEGDINAGLESFGRPFWVETGPDLTFTVHKPGSPPQPASWLSAGQRIILAVPFWLAVGSLWKMDLGLLTLDEPTAALDESNRAFLAETLALKTVEVRGNTQLIMVTHADNLKACFDQIIDLGA